MLNESQDEDLPDDAFRHCGCGWQGRVEECPKDDHNGFSRCPRCRAMVGIGLREGKRKRGEK